MNLTEKLNQIIERFRGKKPENITESQSNKRITKFISRFVFWSAIAAFIFICFALIFKILLAYKTISNPKLKYIFSLFSFKMFVLIFLIYMVIFVTVYLLFKLVFYVIGDLYILKLSKFISNRVFNTEQKKFYKKLADEIRSKKLKLSLTSGSIFFIWIVIYTLNNYSKTLVNLVNGAMIPVILLSILMLSTNNLLIYPLIFKNFGSLKKQFLAKYQIYNSIFGFQIFLLLIVLMNVVIPFFVKLSNRVSEIIIEFLTNEIQSFEKGLSLFFEKTDYSKLIKSINSNILDPFISFKQQLIMCDIVPTFFSLFLVLGLSVFVITIVYPQLKMWGKKKSMRILIITMINFACGFFLIKLLKLHTLFPSEYREIALLIVYSILILTSKISYDILERYYANKNLHFCQECQSTVGEADQFCLICGSKLPLQQNKEEPIEKQGE